MSDHNVELKAQSEDETLDTTLISLPEIPREGEYVQEDGDMYRVVNVVYKTSGITLIVTPKFK